MANLFSIKKQTNKQKLSYHMTERKNLKALCKKKSREQTSITVHVNLHLRRAQSSGILSSPWTSLVCDIQSIFYTDIHD